jgi:hypothetical protein
MSHSVSFSEAESPHVLNAAQSYVPKAKRRPMQEMTMTRELLVLGLLAISIAAPGSSAQTPPTAAPAAAPPAANPVDPAAVQALRDMGAYLLTLKRFQVSSEVTGERVLADGQKLQRSATARLDVVSPNKLHVVMINALSKREVMYDGKTVTLYDPAQKYYSTVDFTGTNSALIDRMESKYGVEIPLEDLFLFGTPEAKFDHLESAMNAGQAIIGGQVCDHYAFRQKGLDWQIWIATGGRPLPRKVVITRRDDDARPQSVSVLTWNLKPTFTDAAFKFTPPKGSAKIEILPRKT